MYTKNKLIAFVGDRYKDFVLYTAFILNNLGERIAICDLSDKREFDDITDTDNNDRDIVTYKSIDIVFERDRLSDNLDYVLIFYSESVQPEELNKADLVFINMSQDKKSVYNDIRLIENIRKNVCVIIMDMVGKNINKKYIKKIITKNSAAINCIYEINNDYVNSEYRLLIDYEGISNFKYLSKRYTQVLCKTAVIITGRTKNAVNKAVEKARGGKIVDNRLLG